MILSRLISHVRKMLLKNAKVVYVLEKEKMQNVVAVITINAQQVRFVPMARVNLVIVRMEEFLAPTVKFVQPLRKPVLIHFHTMPLALLLKNVRVISVMGIEITRNVVVEKMLIALQRCLSV